MEETILLPRLRFINYGIILSVVFWWKQWVERSVQAWNLNSMMSPRLNLGKEADPLFGAGIIMCDATVDQEEQKLTKLCFLRLLRE